MDIHQKREFVLGMYKGPRWNARVKKMSDEQVVAIYLAKQQIDREKKEKNEADPGGIQQELWP